jgi:hypothetical protein
MSTNEKVFKGARNEGELLNLTKILQEDDLIYYPLTYLGFN